jgi:hypothetical protein
MCSVCGEFDEPGLDTTDPLVGCKSCGMWAHAYCLGTIHIAAPKAIIAAAEKRALTEMSIMGSSRKRKAEMLEDARSDELEPRVVTEARVSWARQNANEAFECHLCKAGFGPDEAPSCALCGSAEDNRAMAVITDQKGTPLNAQKKVVTSAKKAQWAHVTCTLWTPGAFFWRPAAFDWVGGLDAVDVKRWKLSCAICVAARGQSTGAPLQCNHPGCKVPFHILCSREAGWEINSTQYQGGVVMQAFCGMHSSAKYLKATAAFDAACEICGAAEREAEMILCDDCDGGYHMDCLSPKLTALPEGAWYCPSCDLKRKEKCVTHEDQPASQSLLYSMQEAEEAVQMDDAVVLSKQQKALRRKLVNACFDNSKRNEGTQELSEEPPKLQHCPKFELSAPKSVDVRAAVAASTVMRNIVAATYKTLVLSGTGDVFAAALATEAARGDGDFMIADAQDETEVPSDIKSVIVVNLDDRTNKGWLSRMCSRPDRRVLVPCSNIHTAEEAIRLLQFHRPLLHFTVPGFSMDGSPEELADIRHTRSLDKHVVSGVEWVMRSLTPNHRHILGVICDLSLESKGSDVKFPTLLQKCLRSLVITSQAALNAHLTELLDHGILERKGESLKLLHEASDIHRILAAIDAA